MNQAEIKAQVNARVGKAKDSLEAASRQVAQQALGKGRDLIERTVKTLQNTSNTLSELSTRIEKTENKA